MNKLKIWYYTATPAEWAGLVVVGIVGIIFIRWLFS